MLHIKKQIAMLKESNIVIKEQESVEKTLEIYNIYALIQYKNKVDDTSFEVLINRYLFDMELRVLLFAVIGEIEMSLSTQIAKIVDGTIKYKENENLQKTLEITAKKIIYGEHRKPKNNMKHYLKNKKIENVLVGEIINEYTLYDVNELYKKLELADRKIIARKMTGNNTERKMSSWLEALRVLRNGCAHYNRVYNKKFSRLIKLSKEMGEYNEVEKGELFIRIEILKQLYPHKEKWDVNFVNKLEEIINSNIKYINIEDMGFPNNYKEVLKEKKGI